MSPEPCPAHAYVYHGVVTRVVDADTVDVSIDLGLRLSTVQRLRLNRVNAPEMRGPSRPQGILARDYAAERLLGKSVVIRTMKSDVFGRWIADAWIRGDAAGTMIDFNAELVNLGYAVAYRDGEGGA